ncbi:hypothetical protein roselon_01764 [Roseibacterium elongatum DSM 19469]|uniref:Uncharacterized protein n=1 Tax=Roseicyclus elongatus DSM 19469 TaxID=1294273 RepID=W8SNL3_9RHOB|nr:hypothetical protein [Roseibacterium elongatum]AHM04130.1 hypothetical protein roselon_01764 [Roseibacterium elongatum DSM 19469]
MTLSRLFSGVLVAFGLFALFVIWALTGPVGAVVAATLTYLLLRTCERQQDAQMALARKTRAEDLHRAFRGDR